MTSVPTFGLVLVDADVISKLAHWELLDYLPQAFTVPWHSLATMPSLRYRAQRAIEKSDKLFCTHAAARAALDAINRMGPLPEMVDPEFIVAAQRIPELDPGEAVLLATAVANPRAYVLTGDKRALAASVSSGDVLQSERLNGRLICLEQFILHILNQIGLDQLRIRLCREPRLDRAITAVMGSTCTASEADVRQGLGSYISDAKANSGQLLVADWPATRQS